jgi:hypothetical protein
MRQERKEQEWNTVVLRVDDSEVDRNWQNFTLTREQIGKHGDWRATPLRKCNQIWSHFKKSVDLRD